MTTISTAANDSRESSRRRLGIDLISRDPAMQPASRLNEAFVEQLAEAMADPEQADAIPPVTVVCDGAEHWLVDGHHRVLAAERLGRTEIDAVVLRGDRRHAIWLAAGANKSHGLNRTTEVKREVIGMALRATDGAESDRAIAKHCGVSHVTVASVRRDLEAGGQIDHVTTRVGADGKQYPRRSGDAIRDVPVDAISLDVAPRAPESYAGPAALGYVEALAEHYRAGVRLPPIEVCEDDDGVLHCWDGHFRVRAARQAGLPTIEAHVRPGDDSVAQWLACGANADDASRGTVLTLDDLRRAVALFADLSVDEIAVRLGVRREFVEAARAALA